MTIAEMQQCIDQIANWLSEHPDHFTQNDKLDIMEVTYYLTDTYTRKRLLKNVYKIPWHLLMGIINTTYNVTKQRYVLTHGVSVTKWSREELCEEGKTILGLSSDKHCVMMKVRGPIMNSVKQLSHLWGQSISFKLTNASLDMAMPVSQFFHYFSQAGIHVDPIMKGNMVDIGYLNEQIRCQLIRRRKGKEAIRILLPEMLANIAIEYAYPNTKNLS